MIWIYFVGALLVFGAVVELARRGVFNGLLYVVHGIARIECRSPRIPANVAKLTPAIVREPLERIHCERWKHHPGKHEAKMGDSVEHW